MKRKIINFVKTDSFIMLKTYSQRSGGVLNVNSNKLSHSVLPKFNVERIIVYEMFSTTPTTRKTNNDDDKK